MEYLKIAENFGKIIWPYKNKLKITDLMLFGSVAYGKKNPKDLDLLVLHYSPLFEEFQEIAESNKIEDSKKLAYLSNKLNGESNILNLIKGTSIEELILQNKFNTKFMDIDFFTNQEYRKKWRKKNYKIPNKPELMLPGETFEECIFKRGLLYNQKTQKYDIPALQKYNPKKLN